MALASSLEKYQEIIQLTESIERADKEFGQDLWLIAERIALHRITKESDGKTELDSIFHTIQSIRFQANHTLSHIPANEHKGDSIGQAYESSALPSSFSLVSGFSLVVDLIESMDSSQLYQLIAWLRNENSNINETNH